MAEPEPCKTKKIFKKRQNRQKFTQIYFKTSGRTFRTWKFHDNIISYLALKSYVLAVPPFDRLQTKTQISNLIWIYKIIPQPELNNILIAILQSYLPKYFLLHTTFNNTNTIFTTPPANTSIRRKFFSHNGVPPEWRGIVPTSKPEVHAERNTRGKLVLHCADTHFSSLRINSRPSLANRVWPVRFEFTRLSRKWEEKREQGERWKVKRESWEEEVGPQQNSLKIVYSVFCCGGDCCDFPVYRFSASLTGKQNYHSILSLMVELKSVNLPKKNPWERKENALEAISCILFLSLCVIKDDL